MKSIAKNKMGELVEVGTGKDKVQLKLTPAAARAILTFKAGERDSTLLGADKVRAETGHPKQADKAVKAIWDDHIALSLGVKADQVGEWRKERELPRPAVA